MSNGSRGVHGSLSQQSAANQLLVNQQLAFARLALAAAREFQNRDDIQSRFAQHAALDAAINHLCRSLVFFLREISAQYRYEPRTDALDVRLLLAEIENTGLPAPEIAELASQLRSSGWMAELVNAGRDPLILANHFKPRPASENGDNKLIPVRHLSEADQSTPLDRVTSWQRQLQDLLERLRLTMVEE